MDFYNPTIHTLYQFTHKFYLWTTEQIESGNLFAFCMVTPILPLKSVHLYLLTSEISVKKCHWLFLTILRIETEKKRVPSVQKELSFFINLNLPEVLYSPLPSVPHPTGTLFLVIFFYRLYEFAPKVQRNLLQEHISPLQFQYVLEVLLY